MNNTERSFKCRICGGEVTWEKGCSMGECLYCGSKQPIPSNLTAHTQDLYNDAFDYLKKNEYDKAFVVYENIIKENPNDSEAYWGRCLCRYGIEYVDDPNTGKKIPTCHRLQAKSILKDEDYLSALKYAPDEASKSLYTMRATTIDVIQRDIISISQGEEGKYDIFISFKDTDNNENRTKDSHLAEEIYNELTKQGYKVFFSRVTLAQKLGAVYEPYIYAAIHSAKVMIVVGTKPEYIESAWVRNEWSRYLDLIREGNDKKLIVCFKDMSRKTLPEEFVPFQNLDMNERGSMVALVQNIEKIVKLSRKEVKETTPKKEKKKSGCGGCLIPLLIVLGIIGAIVYFAWGAIQNLGQTDNPSSGNNNWGNVTLSGELTQIQLHVDKTSVMYGDTIHLSISTSPSNPTKVGGKSYNANCIEYYGRINGVDQLIGSGTSLDCAVAATGEISIWAKYCHHSSHSDTVGDVVSNEVKITVANENGLYYKDNGNGVEIVKYRGSLANLTIPSSINGRAVNGIASGAFLDCSTIKTITVPDSVTSIGFGAFSGCNNLTEMTLPFVGYTVNAAQSYEAVFGYIFGNSDNDVRKNYTPDSTSGTHGYTSQVSSGGYMYYFSIPKSIRKVTITNQTNIPACAFQNCDLIKEITFSAAVTDIGMSAFQNCSALSTCSFTASEWSIINQSAFQNCKSLKSFSIPKGIFRISNYAFIDCTAMVTLEIPNTVETISQGAFKNCTGLTEIIVPESVTEIGFGAFYGCNNITDITLPFVGYTVNAARSYEAVFGYIFGNSDNDVRKNYTPDSTSGTHGYTSQVSSGGYMYYFSIPKSIRKVTITNQTNIPACAFQNCDLIKEIIFTKTVDSIGDKGFANCTATIQGYTSVD